MQRFIFVNIALVSCAECPENECATDLVLSQMRFLLKQLGIKNTVSLDNKAAGLINIRGLFTLDDCCAKLASVPRRCS